MLRIGISRWLSLLGASPVAISLGLSLFLLSPSVSAQTAEQLEKQYGREAMQKALETKHLYDLYGIHFDVDKATIRPETQPLFDDIAQMLKNFPIWRLSIVGHTDSTGDAAHNQRCRCKGPTPSSRRWSTAASRPHAWKRRVPARTSPSPAITRRKAGRSTVAWRW